MKAKKGKALAMKLIDDLLGDGPEDHDVEVQASEEKNKPREDSASIDIEISDPFVDPKNAQSADDKTEMLPNDQTHKLSAEKAKSPKKQGYSSNDTTEIVDPPKISSQADSSKVNDQVRSSVGRFTSLRGTGLHSPAEAAMAQSENLRIAQTRILELEQEIERIRQENEQLAAAGETLRRRADEVTAKLEKVTLKAEQNKEAFEQEKDLLNQSVEVRRREVEELQLKIDELEMRLSTNIQKIRVRERELENRLELVKMEGQALIRSKDEIILDLKRQLDQVNMELENYRSKGQELNKQLSDKHDMLRRTVKALRIALSMLEGDEEIVRPLKKAK